MSISVYKRFSYLLILGLLPLIVWITYSLSYSYLLKKDLSSIAGQLRFFASDLEAEIEKFSFLPRVLSRNQKLKNLLSQDNVSVTMISGVNRT